MTERRGKYWRQRTPTVIQMEAVECGAACLGIILGHYGRYVPLERLRIDCGVSRDGSNALNVLKTARKYGLEGKGYQKSAPEVLEIGSPVIVLWEYNHFVVVEGLGKDKVFLNDPANGPRSVSLEEFEASYSGVVLSLAPTEAFEPGDKPPSLVREVMARLKSVPAPLFYLFLAGLCLLLPGLALPVFTRIFVDEVLVSNTLSWGGVFLVALLLVAVVGGVLIWLQHYFLNRLSSRLSINFSGGFLWHILRLPAAFYTQRFPGEIAYRATLNTQVAEMMTGTLASTCIDLLLILFYGLVMLSYDWVIGTVGFIAAGINIGVFLWIQRSRSDAYARLQQEWGKWIGNSIGALQHIETIKATGIESDFFGRFAGYYAKNLNANQEISKKDVLLGATPAVLRSLSIAALLSIGAIRVIDGDLTIGMLIALQTLMISFLAPIARFINFGQTMQNMKVDVARLNDVIRNPVDPLYEERADATPGQLKLEGEVEFRNVTFGYSRLAPPLIEKLSFTIKPGQRLALVGPSGCGKSTLARLASGLYQPWEGEILYDGAPIVAIAPELFYHSIASVDQDIFLFEGTVRDNLTLWNPAVTDEMLTQAAHDGAIHDDIMLRKKGYDSHLTEGGRNLSGGQRQRLEISRALLYSPNFLIMDEATSALDSETEKAISDRIRRRGCSAIMIAHRLSTIQDCDEILVLEEGKVVQRGDHQSLRSEEGLYRSLIAGEGA